MAVLFVASGLVVVDTSPAVAAPGAGPVNPFDPCSNPIRPASAVQACEKAMKASAPAVAPPPPTAPPQQWSQSGIPCGNASGRQFALAGCPPQPAPTPKPKPVAAPVSTALNTTNVMALTNSLAFFALLLCMAGICISSAMWAMGSKGQNPGQELTGKKGIVLCCTAAFCIGAVPPVVNFLNRAAKTTDTTGVTAASNATPLSARAAGQP